MKCAVVVAHPDDEVLFAGAMILSRPLDSWHIICMTHASTSDRSRRFRASCNRFGATSEIHDVRDAGLVWTPAEYLRARRILTEAPLYTFDEIYTHGPKGEYGHPHHVAVGDIVRGIPGLGPRAWEFYHGTLSGVGLCETRTEAYYVPATNAKRAAFEAIYGVGLLQALKHDHPDLMARLFEVEEFTR